MTESRNEIKKIIADNLDSIIDDGSDDSEALDRIYNDFTDKIASRQKKSNSNTRTVLQRFGIVAAVVVGIFIGSIALSDVPMVQAIKDNVSSFFTGLFNPEKTVTDDNTIITSYGSIEDAENDLKITIPRLNWLPVGFSINSIESGVSSDGKKILNIDYIDANNEPAMYIHSSFERITLNDGLSSVFTDRNMEQYENDRLMAAISKESPYFAVVQYKNYMEIMISTDISKEELYKLIENIG